MTYTLDDLPNDGAPEPLLPPFLAPEGATVLYGKGGRLKGYTALHWTRELLQLPNIDRILILDFENHPYEWGGRAHALGFTESERRRVDYITPYGDYWPFEKHQRGPLSKIVRPLHEFMVPGHDFIVVDSYTTATSEGDTMGGAPAAQEFFNAFHSLGRPGLVLAHVAGGQGRFPDRPFGSVFVHNLARETWAVEKSDEKEDEAYDPIEERGFEVIELRQKKSNGSATQRPVSYRFDFSEGEIKVTNVSPKTPVLAETFRAILMSANEALSVKEIAAAYKSREARSISEDTILKTLKRREGDWFIRIGDEKGKQKWSRVSGK